MPSSKSRFGSVIPRLFTAEDAAHYLGYKSTEILKKIPIKPIRIASIGSESAPRYDRHEIDQYLDRMSGLRGEANTLSDCDEAEALFAEWSQRDATRAA